MATKVFISWSGELSKQIAEAIRSWLPSVIQSVKPYYTPNDINKGSRWNAEIAHELEESNIGIICLTKDNIEKPWILFEAGALSKNVGSSNVCPIMFNFESSQLTGPLLSFQATRFEKSDMKKLLKTINEACGESKLDASVLDNVFEMWWPKLEEHIKSIIEDYKGESPQRDRSDRELLEEILSLSRMGLTRESSIQRRELRMSLTHLLESIDNIQFRMLDEGNDDCACCFEELYPALEHLCNASGYHSWFDTFMQKREQYRLTK
jgi:hypothetical protein